MGIREIFDADLQDLWKVARRFFWGRSAALLAESELKLVEEKLGAGIERGSVSWEWSATSGRRSYWGPLFPARAWIFSRGTVVVIVQYGLPIFSWPLRVELCFGRHKDIFLGTLRSGNIRAAMQIVQDVVETTLIC